MEQILKVDYDDMDTFDKEVTLFYETVREAGLSVINDWIKRGLIDKEGTRMLVEHFDEKLIDLLPHEI